MNSHHQESERQESGFPFLLGSSSVPLSSNEIDCFLVDINVNISFPSVHLNYWSVPPTAASHSWHSSRTKLQNLHRLVTPSLWKYGIQVSKGMKLLKSSCLILCANNEESERDKIKRKFMFGSHDWLLRYSVAHSRLKQAWLVHSRCKPPHLKFPPNSPFIGGIPQMGCRCLVNNVSCI